MRERTRNLHWGGMKHAWGPQGCAARPAKKIEGVEPHPITPCIMAIDRLDVFNPRGGHVVDA